MSCDKTGRCRAPIAPPSERRSWGKVRGQAAPGVERVLAPHRAIAARPIAAMLAVRSNGSRCRRAPAKPLLPLSRCHPALGGGRPRKRGPGRDPRSLTLGPSHGLVTPQDRVCVQARV